MPRRISSSTRKNTPAVGAVSSHHRASSSRVPAPVKVTAPPSGLGEDAVVVTDHDDGHRKSQLYHCIKCRCKCRPPSPPEEPQPQLDRSLPPQNQNRPDSRRLQSVEEPCARSASPVSSVSDLPSIEEMISRRKRRGTPLSWNPAFIFPIPLPVSVQELLSVRHLRQRHVTGVVAYQNTNGLCPLGCNRLERMLLVTLTDEDGSLDISGSGEYQYEYVDGCCTNCTDSQYPSRWVRQADRLTRFRRRGKK